MIRVELINSIIEYYNIEGEDAVKVMIEDKKSATTLDTLNLSSKQLCDLEKAIDNFINGTQQCTYVVTGNIQLSLRRCHPDTDINEVIITGDIKCQGYINLEYLGKIKEHLGYAQMLLE